LTTTEQGKTPARQDPYAALRFRDFRFLAAGRFTAALGEMIMGVAVGWEIYERTGSEFALGLVGLVQIIPLLLLALIAGHTADRFNRKHIAFITHFLLALCSLGLAAISYWQAPVELMFVILFFIGVLHAFSGPATSSLLPQTVPTEHLTSAATWSSSTWQFASVLGPAVGGAMLGIFKTAAPVYLADAVAGLLFVVLIMNIRSPQKTQQHKEAISIKTLLVGFHFIRSTKIILAAITLDMFAVLFGGAVALLPVYAKDILQVGPEGLGWMRAAPSVGAMVMVLLIAHLPPFKKAGKTLLWAVAGFGVATIIFGISTSFPLSLIMLFLLGALDNISVVIRSTLLLTRTPDEMRGRVSAVNSVFIGASNELGAFESGSVAALGGPVFAVVSGGIGTIIVVSLVAYIWPEIRRLGKLSDKEQAA